MRKYAFLPLFVGTLLQAQSINIGNFYYRDYLDFGQNKGSFSSGSGTLVGKDGTSLKVPSVPNFAASSNYGSLTSVGRSFAVTANHVSSPESVNELRKWGLTQYNIAKQSVYDNNGDEVNGVSKPYGRDEKFIRLDKYVVEGQVDMLDTPNTTHKNDTSSTAKEAEYLELFKKELENFKDDDGNIYLYQAGSGGVILRGTSSEQNFNTDDSGEMKGGGFGYTTGSAGYFDLVSGYAPGDSRGITFYYNSSGDFNNRITSGDSGSGIYAYDKKNDKWVLVGVVSRATSGQNNAEISFVSKKDLEDYQKNFEKSVNLDSGSWTISGLNLNSSSGNSWQSLDNNKDIIFSGGGSIEAKSDINRMQSGYAGGFVFADASTKTTYKFTNESGKNYFFKGSGLDIGENVVVEWALRNQSNDALHKVGKGTLIVKTDYTAKTNENLGYLKVGEGKVELDTATKAFEGIYITSGRGEVALVAGKAQAIGAVKNPSNARGDINALANANSYTLAQDSTSQMGFYFGTVGGKFDLAGNSLTLNTIAANDSKAIITNSSTPLVDLEIQGFGYDSNGKKTTNKADTIIHASFGDSTNAANLNLIYQGDKTATTRHFERSEESKNKGSMDSSPTLSAQNDNVGASLIFDGHINIKGSLNATNSNIVLQGHPTTHATISDETIRDKITSAENGTSKGMSECMDLSKASMLCQPDWDSRNFIIAGGITLTNSTLMIGKAANVKADINADSTSQINFGGKHFIDESDGKNVRGSGFDYYQLVTSGDLKDELYEDSSYSGTIKANGTTITSSFFNFAPNLELTNKASLNAKFLTLTQSSTINLTKSTAKVGNLIFKDFTNGNDFSNKFTLDNTSTFSVTQALSFDNSNLNLDTLKTTASNITLPTEYNFYALNGSTITANEFKNTKENAEFMLDKSTFTATNGVSFKSAKISVQNGASFNAQSLDFTENSIISLADNGKLTLTGDLQTQSLNLNLSNSSTLNAKSLTSNGASTINLNDKATLTLTDILTSKNLSVNASNQSTFTASTLNASGVLNLNADENSSITLTTLSLQNGKLQNISENVAIEKLNLTESNANLEHLSSGIPKTIDLKTNSTLRLNELNLNDFSKNGLNLTSDESSVAHIKKLSYDAKTGLAGQMPQSNLSVSELFRLDNVGKNLGTNSEQERLDKDLLALEFGKNFTLESSATLEVNFAELVKESSNELKFGDYYTIFSAKTLACNGNISLNFAQGVNLFVEGFCDNDKNSFLVKFRRDDPRNFGNLNPHIENPAYSPLLEILLEHDKNDESIEKGINSGDYSALNQKLARLDESFETLANAGNGALKALPLLQKQEINARIQQNRFTSAKFALASVKNPAQTSDIVPMVNYFEENELKNRVWSNAGAGLFSHNGDKFTLYSISIGYDRKLFDDEMLLGVMASLTNAALSADEMSFNPTIYSFALYSDVLFARGELQNELSLSLLNGDKSFESESASNKGLHSFFESIYKAEFAFLPKSVKPLVLARVNFTHFDDFISTTYKQKADDDISVDLGLGVEWLYKRDNGFYSATFTAERDIFHSQKAAQMSLAKAQKFVSYTTNEQSFSYQLYLSGLEDFKNGIYLRYGLSAFIDSKAYKGVKADLQVGYKF